MSCYNSERFLRESIDSILTQTFQDFEFIIWNDGSTDGTEEIVKSYDDSRIRYFSAPNQGLGAALAAACLEAHGKYIARMDDDDIALPTRLEKELNFLESHSGYILVSCLCYFIDKDGKVWGQSIQQCTDKALKRRIDIIHPGTMFLTEAYLKSGGYLNIRAGEDLVLWGRMAKMGKFANIAEHLLKYRIQEASITRKLRVKEYNMCMQFIRRKMIDDEKVENDDITLNNSIWTLNVNASKKLPAMTADQFVNVMQKRMISILTYIIGEKNAVRFLCYLKGLAIELGIL